MQSCGSGAISPCQTGLMLRLFGLLPVLAGQFFRSRRDLMLESLALRQQLAVLMRRRPQPRFAISDKLFWVMLRRFWCGWRFSCAVRAWLSEQSSRATILAGRWGSERLACRSGTRWLCSRLAGCGKTCCFERARLQSCRKANKISAAFRP